MIYRLVAVALLGWTSVAMATDRFVSRLGTDGSACTNAAAPCRMIDWARLQAANGDTIKVAAGKYKDRILLESDQALTFSGGWSNDFATRSPRLTPTILTPLRTPQGTNSQVRIGSPLLYGESHTVNVTIDGLTIVRGRNSIVDANPASAADIRANANDAFTVTFVDVDFLKNTEGALSLIARGDATVDLTLTRCRFLKNKARSFGTSAYAMAILVSGDALVNVGVTDTLFARNIATPLLVFSGDGSGGAPQLHLGVRNATITANTRGGINAGVIGTAGGATIDLVNSIVRGNTGDPAFPGAQGLDLRGATEGGSATLTITASHTDMHDVLVDNGAVLTDLGGNVDVDPGFAMRDRYYPLSATSPLVDAGTNTGVTPADVDGDARPQDGDGDMIAVADIGADEVVP